MEEESEVQVLKKQLAKANSLLRSAYSIAERNGESTNWEAFKNQVEKALDDEREILQEYWVDEYERILKTVTVEENKNV
jgi:hypothetical protein